MIPTKTLVSDKDVYIEIAKALNSLGVVYTLAIAENGAGGVHTFSNIASAILGTRLQQMEAAEELQHAMTEHLQETFK